MRRILFFLLASLAISCNGDIKLEDQVLADPLYEEFVKVQKDHMAFIAKGNLRIIKDDVLDVLQETHSPCSGSIESLPERTRAYFTSLCRTRELSSEFLLKYSTDSEVFKVHRFFHKHSGDDFPHNYLKSKPL